MRQGDQEGVLPYAAAWAADAGRACLSLAPQADLGKEGKAAKLRERWSSLPPVQRAVRAARGLWLGPAAPGLGTHFAVLTQPYETEVARRTAESKHTDSLGKRYAALCDAPQLRACAGVAAGSDATSAPFPPSSSPPPGSA